MEERVKSLPSDIFWILSNRKRLQTTIFEFNENGTKFSKSVENIVGKGEITRYDQFLNLPLCFKKTRIADT